MNKDPESGLMTHFRNFEISRVTQVDILRYAMQVIRYAMAIHVLRCAIHALRQAMEVLR